MVDGPGIYPASYLAPRPPLPQLPPDAVDDRLQGTEDTVKVIPLNQLLQNDSDPNGDGLSVTGIGNAVGGTAVLVDGQVVFTPDPDFNGAASFTYTISDGNGGSDTATAVIDVAAVNDGPVLEMDGFTFATTEQVTSQFQHDIANFIDVLTDVQEGQQLDASFVNGAGPITLDDQDREVSVSLHTDGAGFQNVVGYYVINPDGSFGQPQLVFPNASIPPHQPGDSVSLGVLPAGTTFGLFMIQNAAGNPLIQQVANGTAAFSFVQSDGDGATLFDSAPPQLRVHAPDADPMSGTPLNLPIFHTAADADASFNGQPINTLALNTDGQQHVAAGVGTEPDRIAIGWEDLTGGGDRDYNDVILEIDVGEAQVSHVNPANVGDGANLGISDVDSPDMSGAVFRIADGAQAGDTLQLSGGFAIAPDGPLAGQVLDGQGQPTGISVIGGGFGADPAHPDGLSFTGAAPIGVYQAVLGSVTFINEAADPGIRTLTATVTDDQGAASDLAVQQLVVSAAGIQTIMGTGGDDTLAGGSAGEVLFGADGNDTINAGGGNDLLIGGDGNDTLNGGSGNDTLFGGRGDDTLRGGGNNDIYRFERGDGDDVIDDAGGSDTLQLGAGIAAGDLEITVEGQDIAIAVKDADGGVSGDRIVIKNGMTAQNRVESLRLADGSVINLNLSSSAGANGLLSFGNSQLNQLQFWKDAAGGGSAAIAGQMAAAMAAVAAGAVALSPELTNAAEQVAQSAIGTEASLAGQASGTAGVASAPASGQILADLYAPAPAQAAAAPAPKIATLADLLAADPAPILASSPPPPVPAVSSQAGPPAGGPGASGSDVAANSAVDAESETAAPVEPTATVAAPAAALLLDAQPVFDPPATLTDDSLAATEDTPLVLSVQALLGNDHDPGDGTLQIVAVGNAVGGTVALDGSQIVFTPAADFHGLAGFRYTVRDEGGNLSTANAVVDIAAINDAPVAGNESFGGTEDTALVIAPGLLLANDGDVDGDNLTVQAVLNPVGGSVVLDGDGNVVFTPDADFNGPATFQYTVSDGQGGTATATVTVVLAAVNDAPAVIGELIAGTEDTPVLIAASALLTNDSDVDGDALTIAALANAVGGTVALDGNGDILFTPTPNYNGSASFDYAVDDGQGGVTWATAVVAVAAVNDAPTAGTNSFTMDEDTSLSISVAALLANDSDVDGNPLTVSGVSGAANGTVSLSGGNITFTPNANFYGNASFQYTVSDGQGGTTTAAVTITVNDVAEPIPPMPAAPGYWTVIDENGNMAWYSYPGNYVLENGSWVWVPAAPPIDGDGDGDPVVIDLNGDGIDLISVEDSTAFFDMNADGYLDHMGWVSPEDGLLAYDHNQDGEISRRDEIAFIDYLPGARTDLEGLRAFDSNANGLLDAGDAEWSEFGVWQDADQDGVTDDGEFRQLDEVGITGISLTSDWNTRVEAGNTVYGEATYYNADGSIGVAGDVRLDYQSGAPPASVAPSDEAQLASLKQMMAAFTGGTEQQPINPNTLNDNTPLTLVEAAEELEKVGAG